MNIIHIFVYVQLCKNDYFSPNSFSAKGYNFLFPWYLAKTTDEVEHTWYLSSHSKLLGVWRSNFSIFRSTQLSSTREQRGEITALYLVTLELAILGVADKSIYLLLFSRHIQGSSGFMRSCMFLSMVNALLRRSTFIIVCLSSCSFSGSVGVADAPPVNFTPAFWQG